MKLIFYNTIIVIFMLSGCTTVYADSKDIEFTKIVKIAFENSPEVEKALLEIKKFKGETLQSKYLPNPELEFDVENFGGNVGDSTFSNAEITFNLTQKIELGGKRKFRKQSAFEKQLASIEDYKMVINGKLANIFILYNKTAIALKRFEIAKKLYKLSEESLSVVSERVKYGKTSPIQKIKAQLELEKAKLNLKEAKSVFISLKKSLASELGLKEIPPSIKFKGYVPEYKIPNKKSFEGLISSLPIIKKGQFLKKAADMELKLTRALNVPDLNVSVGMRKFRGTNETAYVVSFGINLPIFNRNKGLIMKKTAERDSIFLELKQNKLNLKNSFKSILNSLNTAKEGTIIYENNLLPKAKQAYQSVFIAYKEGKLNYLELLDTQRTLINVENEFLMEKEKYVSYLGAFLELSGYFSNNFLNNYK